MNAMEFKIAVITGAKGGLASDAGAQVTGAAIPIDGSQL